MSYFLKSALAAAIISICASSAHADTVINFGAASGTDTTFVSYSQGGYLVSPVLTSPNGGWVLNEAQGNLPPAITGGNAITANGTITENGASQSTITITDGGQLFAFEGLQLDAYGNASYSFTGTLNGNAVFTNVTGSISSNSFAAVDPIGTGGNITSLTVTVTDSRADTIYALDNIDVTPTPEPNSLVLLGTGLVGMGAFVRRRFAL